MEEAYAKAVALKDEGNLLFKKALVFEKHTLGKNQMVEACSKYAEALEVVTAIDETEYDEKFTKLVVSVYLNLAASGLKLESFDSAINCCNAVLKLDPKNPKALYRRAKVYKQQLDYPQALSDLKQAISITPSNKELREEYKAVRKLLDKQEQLEAFKRETEQGRRGKQAKNCPEIVEENTELTLEWIKELDLEQYTRNGAVLDKYAWGQTVDELHLLLRIRKTVPTKQIKCLIKRQHVEIVLEDESVLTERLNRPVTVDECSWELEGAGCLHVTLLKENSSIKEQKPGYEWWDRIFEHGERINLDDVSIGNDLRKLPAKQKAEMERSMWEHNQKTPEEKAEHDQLWKCRKQAAKDEQEKKKNKEKAMLNPNKKAVFEMMKEKFPDIPVEFR
mmetsp:Transcript_32633/g.52045  ORF Transcript_32633/g.52045 Transcript_32633/m.52045 type:complete len:392 (+) Transcript_32633:20-1195(+)